MGFCINDIIITPVKELKAQGKKPKSAMNCVIGGIMIIFNLDYDLQITLLIITKNYSHQGHTISLNGDVSKSLEFKLHVLFGEIEALVWFWQHGDQALVCACIKTRFMSVFAPIWLPQTLLWTTQVILFVTVFLCSGVADAVCHCIIRCSTRLTSHAC